MQFFGMASKSVDNKAVFRVVGGVYYNCALREGEREAWLTLLLSTVM